MNQQRPRRLQGLTRRLAQSSQDEGRYPGRLRRTPPSHSVLPTVSDHCTPRFRGERRLPRPYTRVRRPLLVTIKGGGGLPLRRKKAGRWTLAYSERRLIALSSFSLPRGHSGTTEHSSQPTPLLTETWELSSLSRLACTPYCKHSGCKIIQCTRTPPLLDVRSRGRNQDKPCVTVITSCIIIWDEETRSIY